MGEQAQPGAHSCSEAEKVECRPLRDSALEPASVMKAGEAEDRASPADLTQKAWCGNVPRPKKNPCLSTEPKSHWGKLTLLTDPQ